MKNITVCLHDCIPNTSYDEIYKEKKCWVFMWCGRNVDIIEFKFAACAFVSVCAQSAKFHLIKSRNLHTHTHTLASFILSLFSIWVDCGMSGKNAEKKAYCNL